MENFLMVRSVEQSSYGNYGFLISGVFKEENG